LICVWSHFPVSSNFEAYLLVFVSYFLVSSNFISYPGHWESFTVETVFCYVPL
jgi:hypothetical protein